MRPITLVAALLLIAMATDAPATDAGSTLRYRLAPDQVLVYRAVADIESETSGRHDRDDERRRRERKEGKAATHLDMVFSYTADEVLADGSTKVTIEVLAVTITNDIELGNDEHRIEMNADGVKIYDGKKLIQNSRWNEVNLPSGINLRALLDTPIEAVMSDRGEIVRFADPELVKQLLRGANFLHLLTRQPVLSPEPIRQTSTWKIDSEFVISNPLRLRELYQLPGTEKYTVVTTTTHMNRPCLKLSVKGDWPKAEVAGEGEAEAEGSASVVIDLATGVMFTYSSKAKQDLNGASPWGGRAEFKIKSATTIQYVGGRQTYERYKGTGPSTNESTSE